MTALEFRAVTRRYRRRFVLDEVSFRCHPGTVTAFCGPNGAGKSTALRVLAGVSRPDSGTALVNGLPVSAIADPAREVGFLLDASASHPGRSVIETLRLSAMSAGVRAGRAATCLDVVGLADVAARRVGTLSLGMRQRLGIANAMLGDPGILVLDEPSNGLDPLGMQWLDDWLSSFARRGGTVLLSTHHLHAVERIAHRAVIISRGRIVADGDVDALRGSSSTRVVAARPAVLECSLDAAGFEYSRDGDEFIVRRTPREVGQLAVSDAVPLVHLSEFRSSLAGVVSASVTPEYVGSSACDD